MKKILVIVPFPMSQENLLSRQAQLKSVDISEGFEFVFRTVKAAPRNYVSQSDMVLADVGILEAGLDAEEEGFSAVCIDTMSDSGVSPLRSVLSIPVIGPGRTSMLTAMSLGSKFSIITMWKKWFHLYEKIINDLGIKSSLASIRSVDVAPDNQALLDGKEEEIFPLLENEAKKAIVEDNAEVIILGSTTMHQAHSFLSSRLPVPVINPGPLTYKKAELLLSSGLSHSRNAYPTSPLEKSTMLKAMLKTASDFEH